MIFKLILWLPISEASLKNNLKTPKHLSPSLFTTESAPAPDKWNSSRKKLIIIARINNNYNPAGIGKKLSNFDLLIVVLQAPNTATVFHLINNQ